MASIHRPQIAVSAAILREGQLLVVRRAVSPGIGLYSFPGGRVEFGESLNEALSREVREETALDIAIAGLAGFREAILPGTDAAPPAHFVIMVFAARWVAGEPSLNAELDDFRWEKLEGIRALRTTEGLADIATDALRLLRADDVH